LGVGEPGPGELPTWRVTHVEDAVARLGGDYPVRVDHDRADRNGTGDVGGPRLAKGALPVLGKSTPPFLNDHRMPPFSSGGTWAEQRMERHRRHDIHYRWIVRQYAGEELSLSTAPTFPLTTHGRVSGSVTTTAPLQTWC